MMNRIFVLLMSLLMVCFSVSAQSIKELEAKKKKALENLAITNKLLDETQKSKKGTVNQINLLKRSIKQSNEVIGMLNNEISLLDSNIDSLHQEKSSLEERLEQLKQDYAKMVNASYYQRHYFSPMLFILSAEDFSQGYRRFRYLQEMTQYRKEQALLIEQLTQEVSEKENQLTEDKIRKETAISAKTQEARRLESQNKKQTEMLSQLKKKETDLKAQQKRQQKQADQLNNKIQEMIAAEIKKQNQDQKKKGTTTSKGGTTTTTPASPYVMSKEEQLVAGNFEKNKGKLPLPVEKGFISGHYGVQPHPVLSKVTINNKGTYIQTPAGSDARCIFEGEVTQIFSVQGSNTAVIVKHGNYRTVYSNLTSIYVKVGDKVKTKQKLGKIFTDSENDNKTELYLMIYRNTEIQNPEHWLAL